MSSNFKPIISALNLKRAISAISSLVDEATFKFTKEGMSCKVLDPARVGMGHVQYPPISFKRYVCDTDTEITINLTELDKCLKNVGKDEDIELGLELNKLLLNIVGTRYKNIMKIKTLEPTSDDLASKDTPRLRYEAEVKMTIDGFSRGVEDVRIVSDAITFFVDKSKFEMSGEGVLGTQNPSFVKGQTESLLSLKVDENVNVRTTYPLVYLDDILAGTKGVSDIIILEFGNNMPLHISFGLISGVLEYWMAPRIQNE